LRKEGPGRKASTLASSPKNLEKEKKDWVFYSKTFPSVAKKSKKKPRKKRAVSFTDLISPSAAGLGIHNTFADYSCVASRAKDHEGHWGKKKSACRYAFTCLHGTEDKRKCSCAVPAIEGIRREREKGEIERKLGKKRQGLISSCSLL